MKPQTLAQSSGLPTITWLQFLTSLVDWILLVFLQLMVFRLIGLAFNIMLLVTVALGSVEILALVYVSQVLGRSYGVSAHLCWPDYRATGPR